MLLKGFAVAHEAKEAAVGSETMRTFEKAVMLRALDQHWKDHLAVMDQLRQSVNLRGYGQKNPVQEFKRESFSMFTVLLDTINIEMVRALCSLSIESANAAIAKESDSLRNQEKAISSKPKKAITQRPKITRQPSKLKVGRNDPCPCGSGKKYKQCHG
jgi:preprotein translocase subunit SecA